MKGAAYTVNSVKCVEVYTVHCTVYSVQCTVYSAHSSPAAELQELSESRGQLAADLAVVVVIMVDHEQTLGKEN